MASAGGRLYISYLENVNLSSPIALLVVFI